MRFSIIMASYLGEYRNSAKDRDLKIVRAINSVLKQSFQDFEIIVVADGCERTVEIMEQFTDLRIKTYLIDKCKMWSGGPRNTGIENAKGEFILYLDIDDLLGENHLQNIATGLNSYDWVWFDDVRYNTKSGEWYVNPCNITVISQHGTSNVCHRRDLPYRWEHSGYAHDYYFIAQLRQNKNFTKITGGEYYVCHVPGQYDK